MLSGRRLSFYPALFKFSFCLFCFVYHERVLDYHKCFFFAYVEKETVFLNSLRVPGWDRLASAIFLKPFKLKIFTMPRWPILGKCVLNPIVYQIVMWFSSFILLVRCIILIDLGVLNQPSIPRINPTGLWCIIYCICCHITH